MKSARLVFVIIATVVPGAIMDTPPSLSSDIVSGRAGQHNCRLYAAISSSIPDSVIYHDLVSFPQSLKVLSRLFYIDGWGIAYYPGSVPGVERSPFRAYSDPRFDSVAVRADTANCSVVLAHIRLCTVGCCCPGCYTVRDPHPYIRNKNGRYWAFAHNGTIEKSVLWSLIDDDYLSQNPPNGSGLPECDPTDTSLIVDSELLFILLMEHIEASNWGVLSGLTNALTQLIYADSASQANFVLSDGRDLWAFRKGNTLFCLYDSLNGYSAVASDFTTYYQENWQTVHDYELIHIAAGERPEFIDLRQYLAPIVTCPTDTTLLFVPGREACLRGFDIFDPDNNVAEVRVNTGTYSNGRICFWPGEGENIVVLTATDGSDNAASCSTAVNAILTDPGLLTGTVVDTTSTPLDSVLVFMEVSEISSTTNSSGDYQIPDIVPGLYDVRFSRPGFMETTATSIQISPNDTTELDIVLRPGCIYVPGDANGNGEFNGIDVSYSVNFLKGLGPAPIDTCNCPYWGPIFAAADANGNCSFNGVDVTYSVNYLKGLGHPPQACSDCEPSPSK